MAQGFGLKRQSATALIAALVVLTVSASAQEPTLDAVLARAGAYVLEFQRRLSGVVSEEIYVQDVLVPLGARVNPLLPRHRELKSDLLVVKPVGGTQWMQF